MKREFKNYCIAICSMTVILMSCSTSKELRQMHRKIDGNWVLQTVVTEGPSGKPKDKIFNEADFGCFIGSDWKFNRNNKGSYMLVDKQKDCPAITRNISWSFTETPNAPETITVKRFDENNNVMNDGPGFILTVNQLDNTTMKLKSDLIIDGHAAAIIYNFVKQ